MGNGISGIYYDYIVKDKKFNRRGDFLYDYAYFFDDPDSILYSCGYEVKNQEIIEKARVRASIERPIYMESTRKERFVYLTSLPEELLSNCLFQQQAKAFWIDPSNKNQYDKDIVRWALKYRGLKECKK